jgi:phage anti-repressor protein
MNSILQNENTHYNWYMEQQEFTIKGSLTSKQVRNIREVLLYTENEKNKSLLKIDEFIKVSKYDINKEYVGKFWNCLNKKGWVLMNKEEILLLGYKNEKGIYRNFNNKLKKNFVENNDYKLFGDICASPLSQKNKKKENGGHNRKVYEITSNTYKTLIMEAKTKQGVEIRKYFLQVETLFNIYCEYVNQWKLFQEIDNSQVTRMDFKLVEYEKKIEELENKLKEKDNVITQKDEEMLQEKLTKEKNGCIYIVSSKQYAKEGLYKVGRTNKTAKNRIKGSNTYRREEDKVVVLFELKTYNTPAVESYIHQLLDGIRDSKNREYFKCPFLLLRNFITDIIDETDDNQNKANDIIKKIFEIEKQENNENIYMKGIDMSKFENKNKNIKIKIRNEKVNVKKEKVILESDDIYKIVKKLLKLYIKKEKTKDIKWKDFQQYIRDNINTINENVKINKIMPWKQEVRKLLKKDKYKSITLKG